MIHPSSVVSPEAKIGKNVVIGPNCRVFDNVVIGDGCTLDSHVVLGGPTSEVIVGKDNHFFPFNSIGANPQDLKYRGEKTKLVLGDKNVVREFCTLNIGTVKGGGQTIIGSNNLIMAYCHVAHDNIIGSNCVIANQTQLAGHVTIEDNVNVGGLCAINQFVRLGKHSFIAGASWVHKDVMPFSIAQGNYATTRATNKVGMERSGFSENAITQVNRAIRILTKGETLLEDSIQRIQKECDQVPEIEYLLKFIRTSERGLALS